MIQGAIGFMRGISSMPLGWQLWVHSLAMANLLAPLFFLGHREAQWTLAAFFASFVAGTLLFKWKGFTRLLGLMHVFWIPLLIALWYRLEFTNVQEPFGIWLRVLMVMNAFSLLIDATDVTRYFLGERNEQIPRQTG